MRRDLRWAVFLSTMIGPAGVQTHITSRKVDWCLINELSINVQYICIMRPNLSLFSVTVYRYLALLGSSSPYVYSVKETLYDEYIMRQESDEVDMFDNSRANFSNFETASIVM